MYFQHIWGLQDIAGRKLNRREAVRAVIFLDKKLLLIQTNRGDYKFPGGGRKEEEDLTSALIREVKEETGYRVLKVREGIGEITENYEDSHEPGAVFQMTSVYYICEVSGNGEEQTLDGYEAELGFRPVLIVAEEALRLNEEILKKDAEGSNLFLPREICALREAIKYI